MTPPDQRPRVRVVTVNYDGGPLTLECIEHLRATDGRASASSSCSSTTRRTTVSPRSSGTAGPTSTSSRARVNLGFAGGTNLGIGALDDVDYVALVNNDV